MVLVPLFSTHAAPSPDDGSSSAATTGTSAATITRLKALLAELQALREELAGLRSQVSDRMIGPPVDQPGGTIIPPIGIPPGGTIIPPIGCAPIAGLGNYRRGSTGSGVQTIQAFLVEEGEMTADSTTGYFGPMTERALQHWQASNGVVSSGDPQTTGYGVFGPATRAHMANRCNERRAFRASPSFGKAPLSVQLAGFPQAVASHINSCSAATSSAILTINWGDGSEYSTTPGDSGCVDKFKKHTYTKNGSYTVTASYKNTLGIREPNIFHPTSQINPQSWNGTARVVVSDITIDPVGPGGANAPSARQPGY